MSSELHRAEKVDIVIIVVIVIKPVFVEFIIRLYIVVVHML